MIFSHKHKIIFIRVRKTGSSSVAQALLPILGFRDHRGLSPKNRLSLSGFSNKKNVHATAQDVINRYSQNLWDKYFTFAFVRNPWDRIVSRYFYLIEKSAAGKLQNPKFKSWYTNNPKNSFNDWCKSGFYGIGDKDQIDFLINEKGEIVMNFIGRFENIDQDFKTICEKINVNIELPHTNKSKRGHYRDYYCEETKNSVAEFCKRDIEAFNYKF